MAGLWLAIALALGCGGPVGPIPGGALSGAVEPAPADWSFASEVKQLQLETNPAHPHSVNTWTTVVGGKLYVPTSMIRGPKLPTEREWVRNVAADARVRVRIEDAVYELRASRVLDAGVVAAVRASLEKKYALSASDLDPSREIWIFRLDAR